MLQRSSVYLFFVIAIIAVSLLSAVVAQTATEAGTGIRTATEIDLGINWRTFQEQLRLSPVTPEERVKLVEQWRTQSAQTFQQIAAVRRQEATAVDVPAARTVLLGRLQKATQNGDPIVSSADVGVATGLAAIDADQPSPEDRVKQVNALLAEHREARAAEAQARRQAAREQAITNLQTQPLATAPRDAREARAMEIHREISDWMALLKPLTPEQRIAAWDDAVRALRARMDELKALGEQPRPESFR